MSARTTRDLQATGLNRRLLRKMNADLPGTVTDFVFNGEADDASQKRRNRAQSLYFWVGNSSELEGAQRVHISAK